MAISHHRSQLEPAPFSNWLWVFNRFPLQSLAFTTEHVLIASRSLFQDFSTLIILEILNCFHCTHGIQKYYALEPYLQCATIKCTEAPALLHQPQECDSPPNEYDWKRGDVSILHFAFARVVTRPGEEVSRATYTHTPPASTGKSPSAIQHSLVLPVRRWGTLGSAPGFRPHRWHCTGSRAATGSTFLQIHKLTAMRNVSASLPLRTQPFVFFFRKSSK